MFNKQTRLPLFSPLPLSLYISIYPVWTIENTFVKEIREFSNSFNPTSIGGKLTRNRRKRRFNFRLILVIILDIRTRSWNKREYLNYRVWIRVELGFDGNFISLFIVFIRIACVYSIERHTMISPVRRGQRRERERESEDWGRWRWYDKRGKLLIWSAGNRWIRERNRTEVAIIILNPCEILTQWSTTASTFLPDNIALPLNLIKLIPSQSLSSPFYSILFSLESIF